MTSPGTVRIALDRIEVGERLRKTDPDYAAWIAASMAEDGQMTPIEVRPIGHANAHKYRLTAGAHRLEGARINGWEDIEAKVVKATDLKAELREIIENLVRHELSPMDRATALARMQAVYLELHPETARGKPAPIIAGMQQPNWALHRQSPRSCVCPRRTSGGRSSGTTRSRRTCGTGSLAPGSRARASSWTRWRG